MRRIVMRQEVQKHGRFRTGELILGYHAALAAGRPHAPIAG